MTVIEILLFVLFTFIFLYLRILVLGQNKLLLQQEEKIKTLESASFQQVEKIELFQKSFEDLKSFLKIKI